MSKQGISGWLMLACALFAGVRAGSFVFDPCRLSGSREIERQQAMLTNDPRGQLTREEKHLLKLKTAMMLRPELDSPAIGQIERPAFQTDPYRRFAPVEFWADHAEFGPFDLEAIADADLNLTLFITYRHGLPCHPLQRFRNGMQINRGVVYHDEQIYPDCGLNHPADNSERVYVVIIAHAIPSRFNAALRYRQLYTFQNQFSIARMVRFSHIRDEGFCTTDTGFGAISSPSPSVLSTYEPCTLQPRSGIPEPGWTARRRFTQNIT